MRRRVMDESDVARLPLPAVGQLLGEDVSYWPLLYWVGLASNDSPTPWKPSHVRKQKQFILHWLPVIVCLPVAQIHASIKHWVGRWERLATCVRGGRSGHCYLATDRIALYGPGALKVCFTWLSDSSETTWEPTHSVPISLLPLRARHKFLIVLLEYFF